MCAEVYFKGQVEDCHFVPVAISYDRPPDMEAHVRELLGNRGHPRVGMGGEERRRGAGKELALLASQSRLVFKYVRDAGGGAEGPGL